MVAMILLRVIIDILEVGHSWLELTKAILGARLSDFLDEVSQPFVLLEALGESEPQIGLKKRANAPRGATQIRACARLKVFI